MELVSYHEDKVSPSALPTRFVFANNRRGIPPVLTSICESLPYPSIIYSGTKTDVRTWLRDELEKAIAASNPSQTTHFVLVGPDAVVAWHTCMILMHGNFPDERVFLSSIDDIHSPALVMGFNYRGVPSGQLAFHLLKDNAFTDTKVTRLYMSRIYSVLSRIDQALPDFARPDNVAIVDPDVPHTDENIIGALRTLLSRGMSMEALVPEAVPYLQRSYPKFKPLAPVIGLDTEVELCASDPDRMTIWHPRAGLICVGISVLIREGSLSKPMSVIVPDRFMTPAVYRWLWEHVGVGFAHNRNFDGQALYALARADILEAGAPWICTMGAPYCINQNVLPVQMGGSGLGLKPLSGSILGCPPWADELDQDEATIKADIAAHNRAVSVENRKRKKRGEDPLPLRPAFSYRDHNYSKLATYCGVDVGNCLAVGVAVLRQIFDVDKSPEGMEQRERGLSLAEYFFNLYTPMMDDLLEIERVGILTDRNKLRELRRTYEQQAEKLGTALRAHPHVQRALVEHHVEFNVISPKFCVALMTVTDQLHLSKKTSGGSWSCDKKILNKLRAEFVKHEDKSPVQKLWNYVYYARRFRNLISKNIDNIEQYITEDGRVRPSYKTAKMEVSGGDGGDGGTKTGRVTTQNPSTNTYINEDSFLEALIAPEGMFVVKWDWASIEPLIHALLARHTPWVDTFWARRKNPKDPAADLYKLTYAPVIGVSLEEVSGEVRQRAKVFLLAQLYDRHYKTVAEELGIDEDTARRMCDNFWEQNPAIARRSNMVKLEFLKGNPIRNIFGQRAFYPLHKRGGYSDKLISTVEEMFMDKPLYAWGESAILSSLGLHHKDVEDCRKVGNWEIQAPGWALTASMIRPLWNWMRARDPQAKIVETIHDAYRAHVDENKAEEILDGSFDFLQDLNNGRLAGIPGVAGMLQRMGLTNLNQIPCCAEASVGRSNGTMKEYHRGDKLR